MLNQILASFAAALIMLGLLLLIVWQAASPEKTLVKFVGDFFRARIDFLKRLWHFAGPRLLDKNFLSAALKVIAGGVGIVCTDGQAQTVILVLTLVGTFFFAPWENLPFEDLEGPRPQPTINISGPVQVNAQ
jgi:hypothetical protein